MTTHPKTKDLLTYLNAEVAPSQKELIQSHIARCQQCQKKIEKLSRLEGQLEYLLHAKAVNALPAKGAWENLKHNLPVTTKSHTHTIRGAQMKKLVPTAFLAAIFLAVSLIFAVPAARAQFEELITQWLWTELPDNSGAVSWGSSSDFLFTPYTISYFPEGFKSRGTTSGFIESPNSLSFTLAFDNGKDRYIKIMSSQGPDNTELPDGDHFVVNGHPAVLVREFDLESTLQGDVEDRVKNAGHEHFLLTWFVDDVQIELVSNFSLEEVFRIAESIQPLETSTPSSTK